MIPIFILTIKNSKRHKVIKLRLKKLKVKHKFFYGINGKDKINHKFLDEKYDKNKAESTLGRKMPYTEISAAYGHLSIYKYIAKKNINRALILEDDAWPSKSLKKILEYKSLPKKIDIIGLNCYDGFVLKKPIFNFLNKFNIHIAETHLINISAYIISQNACKLILKKTKGKVISVPDWPLDFKRNRIISSIILPYPVIIDDKNFSYLRNDRAILTPKSKLKRFIPARVINFISFLFYIFHIPYINGRYPNHQFYKEHFFDKKMAYLKNVILKNQLNTKNLLLNEDFYLNDLIFKLKNRTK